MKISVVSRESRLLERVPDRRATARVFYYIVVSLDCEKERRESVILLTREEKRLVVGSVV